MIRNLDVWATRNNIKVQPKSKSPNRTDNSGELWQQVPKMYQAQIKGRCNLQFAGNNNHDLNTWTEEWLYPRSVNPKADQPPDYQVEDALVVPKNGYCVEVDFPFRLFSNCGQDSIARPVLAKNGIPFLPGSSVKGVFRRACTEPQARKYCGDKDSLEPGSAALRFHGAYPVGNWAERINDVVHPQQQWQVEDSQRRSAYALISLYQPRMVFKFSASQPDQVNWSEVEAILKQALEMGVGGKTSTGYGLNSRKIGEHTPVPSAITQFTLSGTGVCSTLRTDVPEFRPNIFKASLRGHIRRLLGGVSDQKSQVKRVADRLLGSTRSPGKFAVVWQSEEEKINQAHTPSTHQVEGKLYLQNLTSSQLDDTGTDLAFMLKVIEFAYVMGGFGKSWRRVWHKTFKPDYKRFAIGCHWISSDITQIQNETELRDFLNEIHQLSKTYLNIQSTGYMTWREAWHPDSLGVYCRTGGDSKAIHLFHQADFKETPAIGGRKIVDDKKKKDADDNPKKKKIFVVSHVWHRMLPIGKDASGKDQYLEIVTVFHGDRSPWQRNGIDQLLPFIEQLEAKSMILAWGTRPQS